MSNIKLISQRAYEKLVLERQQPSRWQLIETNPLTGIQIYVNKNHKIHMHMASIPISTNLTPKQILDTMYKLHNNQTLIQSWDRRMGKFEVLDLQSDGTTIVYTQYLTGMPLIKNRDFVFVGRQYLDEDGETVHFVITSIADNENKKFVRGRILLNSWSVKPLANGGGVLFSYLVQVDPSGSIPVQLVNATAKERVMIVQKFKQYFESSKANGV